MPWCMTTKWSMMSPGSGTTRASTGSSPQRVVFDWASRARDYQGTSLAMPTYSYRCTVCDHTFDIQQAFTDDALSVCPACKGTLRKVFNSIGVTFQGSGFYRTDSRAEAAGSKKSASAKPSSDSSSKGTSTPKPASTSTSTSATTKPATTKSETTSTS